MSKAVSRALVDGKVENKGTVSYALEKENEIQIRSMVSYSQLLRRDIEQIKKGLQVGQVLFDQNMAHIAVQWINGLGKFWAEEMKFTQPQMTFLSTFTFVVREHADKGNQAATLAIQFSKAVVKNGIWSKWRDLNKIHVREYFIARFLADMTTDKGVFDKGLKMPAIDVLSSGFVGMLKTMDDSLAESIGDEYHDGAD